MFRQATLADCCGHDAFEVVRGDCRDRGFDAALMAKADCVIPLAALVGAPLCDRDRVGAETINRDAVRLVCELASPQQWIIMPTTNSGYGIGQKDELLHRGDAAPADLAVRHDQGQGRGGRARARERRWRSAWRPSSGCRRGCGSTCWSMTSSIAP